MSGSNVWTSSPADYYNSQDPSDVNNIILDYELREWTLGSPALNGEPYLLITEQPTEKYKLRYNSEINTTHGQLLGCLSEDRKQKSYPTVQLMNFNGVARISLMLYTVPSETNGRRYIHYQQLVKKKDKKSQYEPHYVNVGPDNNFTAVFDHMGIIHLPKQCIEKELAGKKLKRYIAFCREDDRDDIKNSVNLKTKIKNEAKDEVKYINPHVMCLCFEAFIKNKETGCWEPICKPVFSVPIKNSKSAETNSLHIRRMDKNTSSVLGNEEIFMLVEKVSKKNIGIRFFELDDYNTKGWRADGIFCDKDVHHQYAITFRTPPYKNLNIERDVTVLVALYRKSDNEESEPLQFRYRPKNIFCSCHTDVTDNGNYGALTVNPNEKESRNEKFNNIIVPYPNLSAYHTGNFPGNLEIPASAVSSDINTPSTSSSSQSSPLQMEAETSHIFNFPQSDVDLQAINEILNGDKENNDLDISLPLCSGSCHTDVKNDENYGALTVIPKEELWRNDFNEIVIPRSNFSTYHTENFPGTLQIPSAPSDINTQGTSSSTQSSHLEMEAETSNIFTLPESNLGFQEINEIIYWHKENSNLDIGLPPCSGFDAVLMDALRYNYNFDDIQIDGSIPQETDQHLKETFEYNQVKQDAVFEEENVTNYTLSPVVIVDSKNVSQNTLLIRRERSSGEDSDGGDVSTPSSVVDSDSSVEDTESSYSDTESSDTESESSDDLSDEDKETGLETNNGDIADDTSMNLEKRLKELQIHTDFETSIQNKNNISHSLIKESLNEERTISDQENIETGLETKNGDIADDTSMNLEKRLKELQIHTDFETSIQNKNKISHSLIKESLNEERTISDQENIEKGRETVFSESGIDITTKPEIILDLKSNPEITDKDSLESSDCEIVSTKEELSISKSSF